MKVKVINNFAFEDEEDSKPTIGISPDRLEQIKLKMKEGDDNALADLFRSLNDIIKVATDIDYLDELQESGAKGLLFRRRIEAGAKKAKQVQEDIDKHSEAALIKDTNRIKNMQTAGRIVAASCEPPLNELVEAIFNRMAESKIDYLKLQQIHANEKTEGILDDVVAKYPEVNQKLKDEFGEEAMVSDEAIDKAKENSDWDDESWDEDSSDWEDEDYNSEDYGSEDNETPPEEDPDIQKDFKEFLVPLDNKNAMDVCENLAKKIWEDEYDPKIFEDTWNAALEDNNNDVVKTGEAVRSGYLDGYRRYIHRENKNFGVWETITNIPGYVSRALRSIGLNDTFNFPLYYHFRTGLFTRSPYGDNRYGIPEYDIGYLVVPYSKKLFLVSMNFSIDISEYRKVYNEVDKNGVCKYTLDYSSDSLSYIDSVEGDFDGTRYDEYQMLYDLSKLDKPKRIAQIEEEKLLKLLTQADENNKKESKRKKRYFGNLEYKNFAPRKKKSGKNDDPNIPVVEGELVGDNYWENEKLKHAKNANSKKLSSEEIRAERERIENDMKIPLDEGGVFLIGETEHLKNVKSRTVPTGSSLYKTIKALELTGYKGLAVVRYNKKLQGYVLGFYVTGKVGDGYSRSSPAIIHYYYPTIGYSSLGPLNTLGEIRYDAYNRKIISNGVEAVGDTRIQRWYMSTTAGKFKKIFKWISELIKSKDQSAHRIRLGLFSKDIESKAKEYAWTLAKEIFGDEADKDTSDKIAENALSEGKDESEVMGIIKSSMR